MEMEHHSNGRNNGRKKKRHTGIRGIHVLKTGKERNNMQKKDIIKTEMIS